mgnify:CR=1 FL=1
MDIYEGLIETSQYYLVHLVAWMGPIVLLQWAFFHRILIANRYPIVMATLLVGTYLILTDFVAVHYGVWFFNAKDAQMTLGWEILGVPLEECLFFYLTALIVVQSFVLFLPERLRWKHATRAGA